MSILSIDKVMLNVRVDDKYEAIRLVGGLLANAGHVPAAYIDKMIEREDTLSTYLGAGLAIPHGTNDAKSLVRTTGMAIAVSPEGVDFGEGEPAHLIIGLAAAGDDHLDILTNVAELVSDESNMERILKATTREELLDIFERGLEG